MAHHDIELHALLPLSVGAADVFAQFLAGSPGYRDTQALDELRARDYSRLDELGHSPDA
jgi:hypothetical protein